MAQDNQGGDPLVQKMLTQNELYKVCQWFNAVQDLNPEYLEKEDYQLAKSIYEKLQLRVPNSMIENT